MDSPEQQKEKQKRHWDHVADGWAAWLPWTEEHFSPVTEWMRDALQWRDGTRVLDVGCGAGYPAFVTARAVAPRGSVVAVDLSPQMLDSAARAAQASGLHNISFREMDAEQLHFDAATFDVVTNAYGLMFCPSPLDALSEARRVLIPGGRVAVVVWDRPENSPYFSTITQVAVRQLGFQAPQTGAPGPFRFADAPELASLMRAAGFADVRVEACRATFVCASAEEYCQMFGDLAWKTRLSALSPDERNRFVREVGDAARGYASQGRLRLVATSLCACGRA